MKKPAVFCDRDDTLIYNIPYLGDPDLCQIIPATLKFLQSFDPQVYDFFIISNQSGVARGIITHEQVSAVNNKVMNLYAAQKIFFKKAYYCPHHPTDAKITPLKQVCECRKPQPGMLYQAAVDFDIDLSKSYMIGDSPSDAAAGRAAGCQVIDIKEIICKQNDAGGGDE